MNRSRLHLVVAAALITTLALAGCKKHEEAVATPPAPVTPVAPPPPPAPVAVTASVTSVDLGNAVGADMKVTTPGTAFGKKDTIFAAVSTVTSDPAGTVSGKLTAKWTFQDGQTINEESKEIAFSGAGVTDFQIAKPSGWPVGKYKVDVSLNDAVVQSKDFEVK
ncbi:MAG TPA: hypothetical protein VKM35_07670 [Arenimonas sp.]|uniref:hypothetical protein n=1 Tax=Arenimonas sp. TaxID=1872635 RepID=UPI002D048779|nr:hypothetical protein [Arenimonas sp.]HMB57073.1 hypothetical protein [Arenimonas sp.]